MTDSTFLIAAVATGLFVGVALRWFGLVIGVGRRR